MVHIGNSRRHKSEKNRSFHGVYYAELSKRMFCRLFLKKQMNWVIRCFVFANFGAYGDKVLYAEGERGIMYLPDLTQLDGIIVGEDMIDVPGKGNEKYFDVKEKTQTVQWFICAWQERDFIVW